MQPKKKFGQHFLHEKKILDKIIDAAKISLEDHVLEIGPGLGVLTDRMVHRVGSLTLVEIDDDLIPYLNQRYREYEQVKLIHGDVLKNYLRKIKRNVSLIHHLIYELIQYKMVIHLQEIPLPRELLPRPLFAVSSPQPLSRASLAPPSS